jgi:hypothetical protein
MQNDKSSQPPMISQTETPAKKKARVPLDEVPDTSPTAPKKRGSAELEDIQGGTPVTTSAKQSPVHATPTSSMRSRRTRRPNFVWGEQHVKRLLAALLVALKSGEFVDGEMKKSNQA